MFFKSLATMLLLACYTAYAGTVHSEHGRSTSRASNTIYRDVVVIGGGSSGTYTAVRLKDHNHTVAVVEPKDYLGGNAETYTAPNGFTIDIGVIVFSQAQVVKDYFARFNVPLAPFGSDRPSPQYIDFSTGQTVTNYVAPSNEAFGNALVAYSQQLAKYPALLANFSLSYPVAPDLLLPFGEFVQKYNLSGFMHTIFVTNQGYSPILNISTIYMLKYLNPGEVNSFETGYLTTVHHDVQELYQQAGKFIGFEDVFLSSSVLNIHRSKHQVRVQIQTPNGVQTIIAKKLVITAQPLLSNLQNFNLSKKETNLFSKFHANGYYTGILNNTGLPANFSAQGIKPGAPYDIPTLPGIYSMSANPGAPGLVQVYYGSPTVLSAAVVQDDIIATLARVKKANGYPDTVPNWATFSAHTPFNLMVSNEDIEDGFYDQLFSLQGQRNTFWNGAAWDAQDSSELWGFTEDYLLPRILASLS